MPTAGDPHGAEFAAVPACRGRTSELPETSAPLGRRFATALEQHGTCLPCQAHRSTGVTWRKHLLPSPSSIGVRPAQIRCPMSRDRHSNQSNVRSLIFLLYVHYAGRAAPHGEHAKSIPRHDTTTRTSWLQKFIALRWSNRRNTAGVPCSMPQ